MERVISPFRSTGKWHDHVPLAAPRATPHSARPSAQGSNATAGVENATAVVKGPSAPKYPFEPLLDVDYILDANNYLEDYIVASNIPQRAARRYIQKPLSEPKVTKPTATKPPNVTRLTIVMVDGCFTRQDPGVQQPSGHAP